ncbi:hypothetical protein SAMN05880582_101917 [Rhizobium sp. RU20A]|uniref:hypothetical protein n=1 Tax=Rhizobium sp. RU20A TaxID=1907412 RepID=UPI000954FC89|nr:hypothetical protein [Rhizobium sp. RU20A]SIQ15008.1 hypothetical protein SAMN05880582_101917 [Rhizobium sp. RU20A]
MQEENLYRIVEVSLRQGSARRDIGIMTVRQALELPQGATIEVSDPTLNSRSDGRYLTREQLKQYACG